MKTQEALHLSFRYFVLIVLGFFQKYLFYFIFTPLTFYPVFGFLSLLYPNVATLPGHIIFFGSVYVQIIDACVAGAAYYLLLILNLTTPMKAVQRITSILFLFGVFLCLNIVRILVFALIATRGGNYFDAAHMMMWYFGSTIMVVLLWFLTVWLFQIRDIPIYSDAKRLFEDAISKK